MEFLIYSNPFSSITVLYCSVLVLQDSYCSLEVAQTIL